MSTVKRRWSLYRVHIGARCRAAAAAADAAAAAACVMYASSVNGPAVTEHPSVGRTDRRTDGGRRQTGGPRPARRRWRPSTDALAAAGRPSRGVNSPFNARPAAPYRGSSGRGRVQSPPIHDTLNEATKQPFPTTSGPTSALWRRLRVSKHMSLTKTIE